MSLLKTYWKVWEVRKGKKIITICSLFSKMFRNFQVLQDIVKHLLNNILSISKLSLSPGIQTKLRSQV